MGFTYHPHMVCYGGNVALILCVVLADALIALSYFGISSVLFYILGNKHFAYKTTANAYAVFILACGLGHLLHMIAVFYAGSYFLWVTAVEFLLTGVISAAVFIYTLAQVPGLRKLLHDLSNCQQQQVDRAFLDRAEKADVDLETAETLSFLNRLNDGMDKVIVSRRGA